MIGYYIHHHGRGHLGRARAIAAALPTPVTALSSLADVTGFDDVLVLPVDVDGDDRDVTVDGALHWAPRRGAGQRDRLAVLAAWIATCQPSAVVVDVSCEIAVFVRLMGVPVVVMAMPGERTDHAHQLAYRLAEAILAPWPADLYQPRWLAEHAGKTHAIGGISSFDGRSADSAMHCDVLVIAGQGGAMVTAEQIRASARTTPELTWHAAGVTSWLADPWPALCGAGIVVCGAGQTSVADVAAARRPAVVIADDRPFAEQAATARTLAEHQLAITADRWPEPNAWPALMRQAHDLGGERWERWQTGGSAQRAADVIMAVVNR